MRFLLKLNCANDRWNEFIYENRFGNIFFLKEYAEIVSLTFGHVPLYTCITDNYGEILAILPLFKIYIFPLVKVLISLPYSDYGGILTKDSLTHEEKKKLVKIYKKFLLNLINKYNIDLIELRSEQRIPIEVKVDLNKANVILKLPDSVDDLWSSFKPKVRNQVRKAYRSNLKIVKGKHELLNDFYSIYSRNMRDLGSPAYPKKFFYNFIRIFYPSTDVYLVVYDGQPIGGGIATFFKDEMEVPWASSLRRYFKYCPNNLLYWEAMKEGIKKGKRIFRFGRSTIGSGPFKFKMQWGSMSQQLYYYKFAAKRKELDFTSNNPAYVKLSSIWKKLPMFVTNILSPYVTHYIP